MARVRRSALERYEEQRSRLAEEAAASVERELGRYARDHPGASVAELREAAKAAMEAALERYGILSSELAAALYDAVMEAEGLDVPAAEASWEPDRDQVDRVARYQVGKADGDSPDLAGFIAQCAAFARDATKRAADHTVVGNVERDQARGVRYARVIHGERTCTFCTMLASRGCVYRSWHDAAAGNHRGCDCSVVPGRKGQTTVEGQDVDALKRRWVRLQAVDDDPVLPKAVKERVKDLVADEEVDAEKVVGRVRACMETVGTDDAGEILAELGTRDAAWLMRGTAPEPTFATPDLERKVREERPHEHRTALRLGSHGVRCDFAVDERYVVEEDGNVSTVGLADLANGTELKTLSGASSYNTVNGYLKNASRKENAVRLIFDNSENSSLSDDDLADMVVRSRRFGRGSVYMIGHGETYKKIR